MATKRKSSSGSDPKSKRIVKNKMQKTMDEFKHHKLQSGRSGKSVRNPKQAIAIGLSEARRSGADIPESPNRKRTSAKSTAKKRPATKKSSSTKKASSKKSASCKKTRTRKRAATKKRAAAKKR